MFFLNDCTQIHSVDVEAAGLADYGKHGEYVSRQVKTWTRQYEASKTGEIQAMDKVIIRDISDPITICR